MNNIRRQRLSGLLSTKYNSERGDFLRDAEITKGRLSQLLQAGGVFGERAARALEEKLKLPQFYLDFSENDPASWPDDVKSIASALATMPEQQRRCAWAVMVALQQADEHDKPKPN